MWSRRAGCGDCAGRATEASSPLHALSRDDTILRGRGESGTSSEMRQERFLHFWMFLFSSCFLQIKHERS